MKSLSSLFLFLRHVRQEMAAVSWPDRSQILLVGSVVFLLVLFFVLFFLLVDAVLLFFIEFFFQWGILWIH